MDKNLFIEKEMYNAAYAEGFKAGLQHAESVILREESDLFIELLRQGLKVSPPATPILRTIIRKMWE